jgi:hypothetical protein
VFSREVDGAVRIVIAENVVFDTGNHIGFTLVNRSVIEHLQLTQGDSKIKASGFNGECDLHLLNEPLHASLVFAPTDGSHSEVIAYTAIQVVGNAKDTADVKDESEGKKGISKACSLMPVVTVKWGDMSVDKSFKALPVPKQELWQAVTEVHYEKGRIVLCLWDMMRLGLHIDVEQRMLYLTKVPNVTFGEVHHEWKRLYAISKAANVTHEAKKAK